MRPRHFSCVLVLMIAYAALGRAQDGPPFRAVDMRATLSPDQLAGRLAERRVVFVGETHTQYADHLNQLEVIEELHARNPDMAIGVEYLQQRFQPAVDDYIAGRITEQDFLRETEYYRHWGYDYRLYAPIFRFAREHEIPLRALNVPESLPSAVAQVGLDGLTPEQRAELPESIEPANEAYRARLREAFEAHGSAVPGAFDHFVEAQLVWDEGMAASAADYLKAHPGRRMVILTGSGHVAFGSGIPERLERRARVAYTIVLNADEAIEPGSADYVLLARERTLPPGGALGVRVEEDGGAVRIASLSADGAAEKGGLEKGDVLVSIDGESIETAADVRLALWDARPGDRVPVAVRRKRLIKTVERDFEIELQAREP